jgi:hypothetical protein
MSRALRSFIILLALLCGAVAARAANDKPLERGAAIIDPAVLRELDRDRFGLGRMLWPEHSTDLPLSNAQLFALPAMAPVREAFDREFDRYVARHQQAFSSETIGVGEGFAFQLFDRTQLYSPDTRFVLAGIVNRMDRAYVSPESCGEIRLIYRLIRNDEGSVSQRLPMTLNLVLKAKGEPGIAADGSTISCREIARRWLSAGEAGTEKLRDKDGPLDLIGTQTIDCI